MDVIVLVYVIAIGGLLSALGISIDKLVLINQKSALKEWLVDFWNRVDDLEFSDIAKTLASKYLFMGQKFFGATFSIRWFLVTLVISGLLTCTMMIIGKSLGMYFLHACSETRFGTTTPDGLNYVYSGWNYFFRSTDKVKALMLNYVFDFLTLAITVALLKKFANSEVALRRYFWVLLDISACVLMLQICLFIGLQIDETHAVNEQIAHPFQVFAVIAADLNIETSRFSCTSYHFYLASIAYAATILIPTIIYLLLYSLLLYICNIYNGFRQYSNNSKKFTNDSK